jgi:Kef-type K+ transport system membrane component KefB
MIRNIIYILLFILLFIGFDSLDLPVTSQGISTLIVGIMLLTSFLLADVIKKFHLPRLTGYMIMGVILGVSGVGILTDTRIDNLHFLENLALAFIALAAGGELRFRELKKNIKSVSRILFGQIIIIFSGMAILFVLASGYFPILEGFPPNVIIAFGLLFAGTALSTSPATTIGIITETNAQGRVTNLILFITVLKAIVLIIFFPLIITITTGLTAGADTPETNIISRFIFQFVKSIFGGAIFGALIIWYLKKVKVEISIFLFAITLAISELGSLFEFDILLTAMICGIIVQNFSSKGDDLIKGIEIFSLPVYVIFFCFAGASLHLEVLGKALFLTFFLVVLRLVLNFLGNYIGSAAAGESQDVKRYSWMGYIGQAGIALGLGIIIEKSLPAQYGNFFLTILISTVVVNEMIGPILLKLTFEKAKETRLEKG